MMGKMQLKRKVGGEIIKWTEEVESLTLMNLVTLGQAKKNAWTVLINKVTSST
jgi:hypothetical protein